jgi:hypothetical protein
VGDSRGIPDCVEHSATAYRQYIRMPAQVTFLDTLHYRVDNRRLGFAALAAFHNQNGSAQLYNLPVGLGVGFNLSRKGGMPGEDTGINDTQHFLMSPPPMQKYRGQQRVLNPEDIPAEENRKGILDTELLSECLHGKIPSHIGLVATYLAMVSLRVLLSPNVLSTRPDLRIRFLYRSLKRRPYLSHVLRYDILLPVPPVAVI